VIKRDKEKKTASNCWLVLVILQDIDRFWHVGGGLALVTTVWNNSIDNKKQHNDDNHCQGQGSPGIYLLEGLETRLMLFLYYIVIMLFCGKLINCVLLVATSFPLDVHLRWFFFSLLSQNR
jgi:hypothetical protein